MHLIFALQAEKLRGELEKWKREAETLRTQVATVTEALAILRFDGSPCQMDMTCSDSAACLILCTRVKPSISESPTRRQGIPITARLPAG